MLKLKRIWEDGNNFFRIGSYQLTMDELKNTPGNVSFFLKDFFGIISEKDKLIKRKELEEASSTETDTRKDTVDKMLDILSPKEAGAASTSQDSDFDPTAKGPRGIGKEGTRNELAKDLGVPSLSENATLSSVSSLNTEINDPKFGGGSSDTSDIEGFTSDNVDAQVQIENALPLSGLPKELQEDIKRQLEGRGVVHSKSVYRKEMSDTFDKEHSLVRKDLKKEVLDNIESFTNILKPLDKAKAEEQSKKPMFTKHLEILTTIEDGGNSEDKTTFVYREGDPANVFTAMFGVTTKTANRVFKALKSTTRFGKGDTITKAQASVVVNHIRK